MEEFVMMAERYRREAARLNEYRLRLARLLADERDVDKRKDLELRKAVVEAERYEILDDLRALNRYIDERRKHGEPGS